MGSPNQSSGRVVQEVLPFQNSVDGKAAAPW